MREIPRTRSPKKKSPVQIQISKKLLPSAVDRNRVRRLIKEVVRLEWSLKVDRLYVFRVLRRPKDPDYEKIRHAMELCRGVARG